jgi:hypothetical protein
MPEPAVALELRIESAARVAFAASPLVALNIVVRAPEHRPEIASVLLRTLVRIEAAARRHSPAETLRLRELFGDESLWGRSSRSLVWAQVTSVISAFSGTTSTEVHVPCSFDLAALASKYIAALDGGDIPITAQWSGSVFYSSETGLAVAPIPWSSESRFRMPVQVFRDVLDEHFPGSGVLALRRDLLEQLDRYRVVHGLPNWDAAIERLLRGEPCQPDRSVS